MEVTDFAIHIAGLLSEFGFCQSVNVNKAGNVEVTLNDGTHFQVAITKVDKGQE